MFRSYLFVPGNQPQRILKALASEAEAVIIDLEDAVPEDQKETARRQVQQMLQEQESIRSLDAVYIRINHVHSPHWQADLRCVAHCRVKGVFLPKVNGVEDVKLLEEGLINAQTGPEMEILPLVETAQGVYFAYDIACASRRVTRLAFGAIDFSLDLGISLTEGEEELLYARSSLVVASRAAGIAAPVDTVYPQLNNEKGLLKETRLAKQLGFEAKMVIHPRQVAAVHRVFAPSQEQLAWAREIVQAFEVAEREGQAAISVQGQMVDYPVYKQALSLLEKEKGT